MLHKLPCFISRIGKTQPVDHIVQSPFQKYEENLSCDAFLAVRLFKGVMELVLQDAIQPFDLLFFPKLVPVIRGLSSALAMLTRVVISPVNSAFLRIASLPFQKEFEGFPPTQTTNRFRISCQR
jgi:hypothetical protein